MLRALGLDPSITAPSMAAAVPHGAQAVAIETDPATGSSKWSLQRQYQRYREHAARVADAVEKAKPSIVVMSSPESIVLSGNSGVAPRRSYLVASLVVCELTARNIPVVLIGAKNLREAVLGTEPGSIQTAEQMRATAAAALPNGGVVKHGNAIALAMVGAAILEIPTPWTTPLKGAVDVEKLELPEGFADTRAALETEAKTEGMKTRAVQLAKLISGSNNSPKAVEDSIAFDVQKFGFDPAIYAALVHQHLCSPTTP